MQRLLDSRRGLSGRRRASSPPRLRAGGFSLIEVLLAMVLLASGMALAFGTIRAATATSQRGEDLAQRSERMRGATGFLRRRIGSALPIGFEVDKQTGSVTRFIGEAQRIRFVADLPDYLGRGGPHLHDISADDVDGAKRLDVSFATVVGGESFPQKRAPEPLAEDLKSVSFRYRGLDDQGKLQNWQDKWDKPAELPLQVSVRIEAADGPWPEMVLTLPQFGRSGGGWEGGL